MERGFPHSSDSKASACGAGDEGSIPGSGGSPVKGNGNPPLGCHYWSLPGESHGQRSLVGYSPWGHKESDMTEQLSLHFTSLFWLGFPGGSGSKESACNAGDLGFIPGSGRSPKEGNGNPLQYSCLRNSMDRDIVHGVTKSQTQLRD